MEEQKRKRKRKKSKKGKSKLICIEALRYESTNIKSPDGKAYTKQRRFKQAKVLYIENDQGSAHQNIQYLKHKNNRSKKRKKRVRTEKTSSLAVKTSDLKDEVALQIAERSTGVLSSNIRSDMSTIADNVKFKAGSISSKKLGLKEKLQNKLESGRFRWINEKLYTTNSVSALKMFEAEPDLFDIYHQGFSSQVQKWPVNPVDTMIGWIMERSPQMIIADMGCGEAKIAQSVPNKVFSFDLVAVNDFVTACDMSKVPLADESVDIVIYCLSLMGTNLNDFLQEAHRILKSRGILKIAEVISRFECLSSFEEIVCCFGFKLLTKDMTNKMFVQFEFKKLSKQPDQVKTLRLSLKPCLYKRR